MSKFYDFNHKLSIRLNKYQYDFLVAMSKKYDIGISDSIRLVLDSFIPQHGLSGEINENKRIS